jgi:hypothetical protein
MEYEKFIQQTPDKQKELLEQNFYARILHSKNLYYSCHLTYEFFNYDEEGNIKQEGTPPYRVDFRHWILGNYYRMEIDNYLPNQQIAGQKTQTFFDKNEGIGQGTFRQEEGQLYGRIDTVQNSLVIDNIFQCWFDDVFCDAVTSKIVSKQSYHFPYFLKRNNVWTISLIPEKKLVQVSIPYEIDFELAGYQGKKSLVLDPEKGFMPIRGELYWTGVIENGHKLFKDEKFTVEQSKLVNDVWMPTEIKITNKTERLQKIFSVATIKIVEMEQGKVTQAEVTPHFPEGTEVINIINGVSYKTDAHGEPIESTIEPLYGLDPSQVKLPEKKLGKANYVLFVTGLLLVVTAFYLMFRKNKKTS